MKLLNLASENRYNLNGYRNYNNLWRIFSKNNEIKNKVVFDFGTGSGIEALEFAKNGNQVMIGDINRYNLEVATRLLKLNNFTPLEIVKLTSRYPYCKVKNQIDVFYANGVLHHTPKIKQILRRVKNLLRDDNSEAILMLYSDLGYKKYINKDLPDINESIRKSPYFEKMYKHFDSVGKYADWYSHEKISSIIAGDWKVKSFNYCTNDNRFAFVNLLPCE
jgi:SAM-dependent methyltransferase